MLRSALVLGMLSMLTVLSAGQEPVFRCQHPRCQYVSQDDSGSYVYEVDGSRIKVIHDNDLKITCQGPDVLESPSIPRATQPLRATDISIENCSLPAAGSLADTLAAINVTMVYRDALDRPSGRLTLFHPLPTTPLAARHFAGLKNLVQLRIYGDKELAISCKRGFLKPLRSLQSLMMQHVLVHNELQLPPSLQELYMPYVSVTRLPMVPSLRLLSLDSWREPQPAPLNRCDSLLTLRIRRPAATILPDGWLANCSRLKELVVDEAKDLTSLPAKLLTGTSELTRLAFTRTSLETLPVGLLHHSPQLHKLQLNNNNFRTLPSDTFRVARRVQELNLSYNELDTGATDALTPLYQLTELNLNNNLRIGDICGTDGYSPIRNSTQLRVLLLTWTGVSRICRDWIDDMTLLETLDLSQTNITELTFAQLQFQRKVEAEVVLLGAPITVLEMTREEFNKVPRHNRTDGVSVQLDPDLTLECDCRMYWTRRALALPAFENFGKFLCTNNRLLRDINPEEMVCALSEECTQAVLPKECSCAVRPDDDSAYERLVVRVRCERASLDSFPRPQPLNHTGRLYELLLQYNNITELHRDDIQHNIKTLDLRNNSLRILDEETAARLGAVEGSLLLAGNPLECSCGMPLLRVLHGRPSALTDLNNATCSDGRALYAAPDTDCLQLPTSRLMVTLICVLSFLLVMAVAAAIFLGSRDRRFFALAVLHRWGIVWYTTEPKGDTSRRYDVYVTYSHKDEAVVFELMSRLEPTYRLCLHHRDWVPGLSILSQVINSVQESRRTVALVSHHFLESSWTRAEFREAHAASMLDARPRLVVVMLEDPAALKMDDQLRRYVRALGRSMVLGQAGGGPAKAATDDACAGTHTRCSCTQS